MMEDAYALIDVGGGRRLERFGDVLLDRPAPGARGVRRDPGSWADAITYRAGRGWAAADDGPAPDADVPLQLSGVTMLVHLTAGGQVGLFPEHARNADWIRTAVGRRIDPQGPAAPSVLNVFAYTGLATLVAAGAGAAVTHVDASRPADRWARRNAEASHLADRPIRWIADDAMAFLRREARRGRRYDGLLLDPPSYGHGRERGPAAAFRFDRDIEELLASAREVAAPSAFWLLSTHTLGWDSDRLAATLAVALETPRASILGLTLELRTTSGARLTLGAAARFDPFRAEP